MTKDTDRAGEAGSDQLHSEYLGFFLGREEYALDILAVQEIRSYENVTRINNAPPFIRGVINLRGLIVPIVDLRIKFNQTAELTPFTVVIIVNIAGTTVGAVVDSVSDVVPLTDRDIRRAPDFSGRFDTRYIRGIAKVAERMLIVVDAERLMAVSEMNLIREAVPA